MRREAQTIETGHGKQRRIGDALIELSKPRLDIAAEIDDAEVGAQTLHLRAAPQGRGANDGARRKFPKRRRRATDKRIAHVGARQHGGDANPVRQHRRQILHRVHGESDVATEQRLVDLLGEEALAADVSQRLVLDAVARGGDDAEIDIAFAKPVGLTQAIAHDAAPATEPAGCHGCR